MNYSRNDYKKEINNEEKEIPPGVHVGISKQLCQTHQAHHFALLFAYPRTQTTSRSAHTPSTAFSSSAKRTTS